MVNSKDVHPHQIIDKNGKNTTVYRKDEKTGYPAAGRLNLVIVPATPATLDPNAAYAHNEHFSGSRHAIPVITGGDNITMAEVGEWHLASQAEYEAYEIYWQAKGDAEDEGKNEAESTEAGDAAMDLGIATKAKEAVENLKDAIHKKYRFASGEIVTVNKIEAVPTLSLEDPSVEIFVTNNKNDKYSFLSTRGLEGMSLIYSPNSKDGDGFSAIDSGRLGDNIGRPFESSGVFDLAVLAAEDSDVPAVYPVGRYPILTGYSTKMDIATGTSDTVFDFSSIDGETSTYVITSDKADKLTAIRLQPLRQMWNGYDPKDL